MIKLMVQKMQKSNQGAAMLLVILAIFFVSTLGVSVLFSSYNSILMRQIERLGTRNFYTAEELMDQLRVGVQEAVGVAMQNAYKEVMAEYSNILYTATPASGVQLTDDEKERVLQIAFSERFCQKLSDYKVGGSTFIDINSSATAGSYSPTVMKNFIRYNPVEYQVTVTASGDLDIIENTYEGILHIILEGITLNYKSDSMETNISTDIMINTPRFAYLGNAQSSSFNLGNYALVVKELLEVKAHSSGPVTVYGDIYTGAIDITDGVFRHEGAVVGDSMVKTYLVTDEDGIMARYSDGTDAGYREGVTLSSVSSKFITSSDTQLWSRSITVNNGKDVELNGDTFVLHDMTIEGNNEVDLNGRYFGLASGSTGADSSSILFNGTGSTITFGEDFELTMAGNSFIQLIEVSGDDFVVSSEYEMGQSMATPADQLAYLIPHEAITNQTSNPVLATGNANATINLEYTLWSNKTIGYYATGIETMYKPVTNGSTISYFFYKFKDDDKRNEYLQDYVTYHGGEFGDNFKDYVDIVGIIQSAATAGNTFHFENDMIVVNAATGTGDLTSYMTEYENLCQTMDPLTYIAVTPTGIPIDDPYEFMVNSEVLYQTFETRDGTTGFSIFQHGTAQAARSATPPYDYIRDASGNYTVGPATQHGIVFYSEERNEAGDFVSNAVPVGMATIAGVNVQAENYAADLTMLVVGRGGTISMPFTGVMYAEAVSVSASIISSQEYLAEALEAVAVVYNPNTDEFLEFTMLDLFNEGVFGNTGGSTGEDVEETINYGWDLDALVAYYQWERH
ncbi:MAG: hypothetical protein R3Y07_03835 [Eubacteriales bacterium]